MPTPTLRTSQARQPAAQDLAHCLAARTIEHHPATRLSVPCEIDPAAADRSPHADMVASIERDARRRIAVIFAFIAAAAEDAGQALPQIDVLAKDAECRLAGFGSFLVQNGLGSLSDPAAWAIPQYLRSLRETGAADHYAAASVLHLVYGHWPWVAPSLRRLDSAIIP